MHHIILLKPPAKIFEIWFSLTFLECFIFTQAPFPNQWSHPCWLLERSTSGFTSFFLDPFHVFCHRMTICLTLALDRYWKCQYNNWDNGNVTEEGGFRGFPTIPQTVLMTHTGYMDKCVLLHYFQLVKHKKISWWASCVDVFLRRVSEGTESLVMERSWDCFLQPRFRHAAHQMLKPCKWSERRLNKWEQTVRCH